MKPGRNDPCPCGSGKKYKKCCLLKEYQKALGTVEQYKTALSNVLEVAMQFAGQHFRTEMEKAIDEFVRPDYPGDLDETAMMSFGNYFLLDHRLPEGDTIFDRFMERKGSKLSSLEQKMLNPLRESHISLYEVQSVEHMKGFTVKEVFTDEEHWIPERRPTQSLVMWTLIATRIIRVDEVSLMVASGLPFPPMEKPRILEALSKSTRRRFLKSAAARTKFLREHAEFFFQFHLERRRSLTHPTLMTMEGERMVMVEMHYHVLDFEKALDALKGTEEFTLSESTEKEWHFDWIVPHDKGPLETIVRASLILTPEKMRVNCNSLERVEKVKKILGQRLQGFIKHQADKIQDLYQALDEYKKTRPIEPPEEIPLEVQNQLIGEMRY